MDFSQHLGLVWSQHKKMCRQILFTPREVAVFSNFWFMVILSKWRELADFGLPDLIRVEPNQVSGTSFGCVPFARAIKKNDTLSRGVLGEKIGDVVVAEGQPGWPNPGCRNCSGHSGRSAWSAGGSAGQFGYCYCPWVPVVFRVRFGDTWFTSSNACSAGAN